MIIEVFEKHNAKENIANNSSNITSPKVDTSVIGLCLLWTITMYIPDPLPFVDEVGLPYLIIKKGGGVQLLITALLVFILSFLGIMPIGMLS